MKCLQLMKSMLNVPFLLFNAYQTFAILLHQLASKYLKKINRLFPVNPIKLTARYNFESVLYATSLDCNHI